MKVREDVSIEIDSAAGCVNASLEIKQFGFWSGLFGGTPFKTERWTFMEDELVPVDALNLVCARLMRAGVREDTCMDDSIGPANRIINSVLQRHKEPK